MADPPWAAALGSPRVGDCWHYADVGDRQHAVSVLIDHGRGGKVDDVVAHRALLHARLDLLSR